MLSNFNNISLISFIYRPETTATPALSTTSLFPPYRPGDENSIEANQKAILALQNAREFTEGDTSAGLGPLDRLIIKEPLEFQNKSFMSHLQSLPYNETLLTKRIEEYFYYGLHLTFCRKRDDTLAMVINEMSLYLYSFINFVFLNSRQKKWKDFLISLPTSTTAPSYSVVIDRRLLQGPIEL